MGEIVESSFPVDEKTEVHLKDLARLVRTVSINAHQQIESISNEVSQTDCDPQTKTLPASPIKTPQLLTVPTENPTLNPEPCKAEIIENDLPLLNTDNNDEIVNNIIEHEEEYVNSMEWREEPLHLFVLTEAGKPVYSRHGSEDKLSTLMGVLLALISCVQDTDDEIRHIAAGEYVFVFEVKRPLVLVAICASVDSIAYAKTCLNYTYSAIISVLTLSQLEKIYQTQKNFDLRRLLTGTDKSLAHLNSSFDHDPQFMLSAIKCLRFPGHLRDICGQALQQAKANDLAFAILIAHKQVASICRLKEHILNSLDMHIILNLINSSTAFHTGESWTPICLPNFNANGYLHAHISYLDDQYKVCLVLLSADRDAFFSLSQNRKKVVARLNRLNCLEILLNAPGNISYSVDELDIPDLIHFLYKSKSTTSQCTWPEIPVPYNTEEDKFKLFRLYQKIHGLIHDPGNPRKLVYHTSMHETILGWSTTGFELYAVFGPLISKQTAITAVNLLLRWIKSKNEELFMLQAGIF